MELALGSTGIITITMISAVKEKSVEMGPGEAPCFTQPLRDMTIDPKKDEGAKVVLSCKVSGSPKPSVAWFKDGKDILQADVSTVQVGSQFLHFYIIWPCLQTVYICIWENLV